MYKNRNLVYVYFVSPENGDVLYWSTIICENLSEIPFETDVTYSIFSKEQLKFLNRLGGKAFRNYSVWFDVKCLFDAPIYKLSSNKFKKIF